MIGADRSLSPGLRGRDVYAAAAELVVEEPRARSIVTILLRWLELPLARRVKCDAREVRTWATRGVFGTGDCATCIDVNAHRHADGAVNGVPGALRNIRNVATHYVATRRRGGC